jgi:hypothetical protein
VFVFSSFQKYQLFFHRGPFMPGNSPPRAELELNFVQELDSLNSSIDSLNRSVGTLAGTLATTNSFLQPPTAVTTALKDGFPFPFDPSPFVTAFQSSIEKGIPIKMVDPTMLSLTDLSTHYSYDDVLLHKEPRTMFQALATIIEGEKHSFSVKQDLLIQAICQLLRHANDIPVTLLRYHCLSIEAAEKILINQRKIYLQTNSKTTQNDPKNFDRIRSKTLLLQKLLIELKSRTLEGENVLQPLSVVRQLDKLQKLFEKKIPRLEKSLEDLRGEVLTETNKLQEELTTERTFLSQNLENQKTSIDNQFKMQELQTMSENERFKTTMKQVENKKQGRIWPFFITGILSSVVSLLGPRFLNTRSN